MTVVVGSVDGVRSPATAHSPLVGAEIMLAAGASVRLPLDPAYEYGALAMTGAAEVAGAELKPGVLLYLDRGRSGLVLESCTE